MARAHGVGRPLLLQGLSMFDTPAPLKLHTRSIQPVNEEIIARAAEFADRHLRPNAQRWEDEQVQPAEVLREAISFIAGQAIPRELGGQGGNLTTQVRIYEEMAKRDMGFTSGLAVHCNVTAAVSLCPNENLRAQWLPKLISGEAIGAFLLTEPGAGSDATAIVTAIDEDEDGYIINGEKAWVTNGTNADMLALFGQTEAGSGARGIAALCIDAHLPGITRTAPYNLSGSHAMGTTGMVFDKVRVGKETLAFAPGTAFKAAMTGIDIARLGVAAMCNGGLHGGLEVAVNYASTRQTFGRRLMDHQGLEWSLADAVTELEASRALTFQAADRLDRQESPSVLIAHAKKMSARIAFHGLGVAMQALGANGLRREHVIGRHMNSARVCEFMDGTGEVMNIVIGRDLAPRRK